MTDRVVFRRVSRFSGDYAREIESFEQNVQAKFRNQDELAYGPFAPSAELSSVATGSATKLAQPYEIVRYTPIPTGLVMFLPSPSAKGIGPVRFKNQSTGTNIVTIRPLATGTTIDGYSAATMAGAYASAAFFPDGIRNNWIKL